MKVESEEVLYTTENFFSIDNTLISTLIEKAKENEGKRIRICTHASPEDALHEMVIVHFFDTYVRPHKHINKSESFHIIHGECDVILFDELGAITDVISMSSNKVSDSVFYYRLSIPVFHCLIIKSEVVVFHEVTSGPFRRHDTVYAEWSPDKSFEADVKCFMDELRSRVSVLIP